MKNRYTPGTRAYFLRLARVSASRARMRFDLASAGVEDFVREHHCSVAVALVSDISYYRTLARSVPRG